MKSRIAVLLLLLSSLEAVPAVAASIVIVPKDPAGQGFNDPTPAAPVGGNWGTTVGQQRLIVFQEAARIWGSRIPSPVTIKVDSSFSQSLTCTATSAVLGSTYATSSASDFPNAPQAATWYARAEADKFKGSELDPTTSAMNATFNGKLGQTGCLDGTFFYLGLDNNAGANVNLQTVVLHEFAHGLGYYSKASPSGTFSQNIPGAFDRFVFDSTLGKSWDQITDAQRLSSATNNGNVVWAGPNATKFALSYLDRGRVGLTVSAPAAAAGSYVFGTAAFGPRLSVVSVRGQVVAATDAADASSPGATDACSAITNASEVAGKIALVDRGGCNFTVKVKNAQNAGAAAVVVADNVSESVIGMAGTDATVTIPSVLVSQSAGATLRANLPATAFLGVDTTQFAGADASGRIVMFTPNPYVSGSSISHWDQNATPSLLMEPYISADLDLTTDATLPALRDIGWFLGSTAIPTTYVLPSSAHAQGANNAFYTTGLSVANTGAADATLFLKFLGHDQDGRGGAEVTRVVPAGQTVTYADVLGSLFGVSSGFGAIRINADSNQLRIVSQTSTPPPSGVGTFGQAVPAAGGNDLVTTAAPRALFSLRQDAAFRTNAVIANTTEAAAHVDMQLFNAAGAQIGTGSADLKPLEMRQIDGVVIALGGPDGTKDAYLVVSTPTGAARIATYAAVIDQKTNDPRTILPVTLGTLGANGDWLLPSSAHAPGANNAFYTTDVTIGNAGTTDATVTLKFLGHDQDGRSGPEVVDTIRGDSAVTYTDVLGSLFGVSSGFGAIRVSSNSANVRVLSQTSTPSPDGIGTFGQSVPAAGPADFVTLAAPKALVGLRQDSAFRTNTILANATELPTHVDLTLTSATGASLATGSADLQPYEMRQIGKVITTLGGPGLDGTANATLQVSTTTPGARVATYAAIIDQRTNDPRTVLP